jgi:beta-xylosidase
MGYLNPVYRGYFADPFVWRHHDHYFAIGTGEAEAAGVSNECERVFSLLRSPDMKHWEAAGKALARPDHTLGETFWAPEVAFSQGRFWLYYSVGHGDSQHQIRVAVADNPLGPYRDAASEPLIHPPHPSFAIDPHPYQAPDGNWYLFYARDFLEAGPLPPFGNVRSGTGLVMDRLLTMTSVAKEERVVLRAQWDWQRFKANRIIYGSRYDWHTLEGPFIKEHAGHFYCFYSAGCWQNDTYGVDYAVADEVTGPFTASNSEEGPKILRSIPGQLVGPGHNSIVSTPEGNDYLVYHAWDATKTMRQMHITPVLWRPSGPSTY